MTTPAMGFGAVDKVSKSGDTMTGTLNLNGSVPAKLPSGVVGQALMSDGSGNLRPGPINVTSNIAGTLALSPIGYYHIGDVAGGFLPDTSPNANNASVNGTITTTTGPGGMAAGVFGASADYGLTAVFSLSAPTAFSVEVWFNTSALANNVALVSGGSFAQTTFQGFNLILFSDNNVYWDWGNGTARHRVNTSTAPVTAGVWHHAVGTWNGTSQVLYLDGVKVASNTTFTGSLSWPSPQIAIAQAYTGIGGTPHPISLSDAAMFPSALGPGQVAARYQAGIAGLVAGFSPTAPNTGTLAASYMPTVLNAASMPGYDMAGIGDSTTALNNALALCATGAYDSLYIPGTPLISSGLTYTSTNPLKIFGDVRGFDTQSQIRCVSGNYTALSVTNTHYFNLEDITIIPNTAFTAGSVGISLTSVGTASIARVQAGGGGSRTFDTVLLLTGCGGVVVNEANFTGNTYGVRMVSGQLTKLTNVTVGTATGTGQACISMEGTSQSLGLYTSQTQGGDRGLQTVAVSGSSPGFISMHDFAVNVPAVAGILFGGQASGILGHGVWLSYSGGPVTSTPVHGIVCSSTLVGSMLLFGLSVQSFTGHGVWIEGGTGYSFIGGNIGAGGAAANNTYDCIHVATGVHNVNINGMVFDGFPFDGLGDERSAVYLESGTIGMSVTNNYFATGYQTAAVINAGATAPVIIKNNLNYNPVGFLSAQPTVPASTTAYTNATGTDCSVFITGGTVTVISVGGTATGATSGMFVVPANSTITLTYSVAPTWKWFGN